MVVAVLSGSSVVHGASIHPLVRSGDGSGPARSALPPGHVSAEGTSRGEAPPVPEAARSGSAAGQGTEMIVLLVINGVRRGDFPALALPDGDYLLGRTDLEALGIKTAGATSENIGGEDWVSMRALAEGVRLDPARLELVVTLAPALLPEESFSFRPQEQERNVLIPQGNSGFLNYRFDLTKREGVGDLFYSAATELGVRVGDWVFQNQHLYRAIGSTGRGTRLDTQLVRDNRETAQRLILGDSLTFSGELGSLVNFGGISLSKDYRISPYFIKYPTFSFAGVASLPSEVEVSVGGIPTVRRSLAPGEYELQDITYAGGFRDVDIVVKDAFGRETRVRQPYYFTDAVLAEGLHQYSYSLGIRRRDFGLASNDYSGVVASAYHQYGWSDQVNAGFRGEADDEGFNLGPLASFRSNRFGLISAGASASHQSRLGEGYAGFLNYSYQALRWSVQGFVRGFSRDYYSLSDEVLTGDTIRLRPRLDAFLGGDIGVPRWGSFGVGAGRIERFDAPAEDRYVARYSNLLFDRLSVFMTATRFAGAVDETEVFVGLLYLLDPVHTASLNLQSTGSDRHSARAQFQRTVPVGEGYGYTLAYDSVHAEASDLDVASVFAQANTRYAEFSVAGQRNVNGGSGNGSYSGAVAGGLAYAGGHLFASRPITDSFGVVRIVPPLENVRVYSNNSFISSTNGDGVAFVPSLTSYVNSQISINDKDIPINYEIDSVLQKVSPSFRSGALLDFKVRRIQGLAGSLWTVSGKGREPVEFRVIAIVVHGARREFFTGSGGEFYLENLEPGTYEASARVPGRICRFRITVPESEQTIVELGEIVACDLRN